MNNFLDTLKGMVSPDLISGLASRLGESESGVAKALAGALPMVLGGIIHKAQSGDGAQSVFDMAQSAFQQNSGSLGSSSGLLELLGGTGATPESGPAGNLLGSVLGSSADGLAGPLSSYAGIGAGSATSLLGLAATAVPTLLGQHASENNLTAGGLGGMLGGLKDQVLAMLPSGLAGVAGMLGLGGPGAAASGLGSAASGVAIGNATDSAASGVGNAASSAASGLGNAVGNAAGEVRRAVEPVVEPTGGGSRWPLLLLALAVGALLFYFMRGGNKTADTTPAATSVSAGADSAGAAVGDAAGAAGVGLDSASAALKAGWAKLGAMTGLKLADGSSLNAPANGVESKLVVFINDKGKAVNKTTWFSLDRLLFRTASAELLPESQEQLDNLVAILRAYPAVKLKMGGYTDSRGNAALNVKLSGERAKSVLDRVVAAGIAADRLASEGYGAEHPVASNDTPDGRQQNRRVDVRVTAK